MPQISVDEIDSIVAGHHHDPHSILGAHPGPDGITVRALRPLAATVTVVLKRRPQVPDAARPRGRVRGDASRRATCPTTGWPSAYRTPARGRRRLGRRRPETLTDDPYRHLPTLGEIDLHLIQRGQARAAVAGARRTRADAGPAAGAAGGAAAGQDRRHRPPPARSAGTRRPDAGRRRRQAQDRRRTRRRPPAAVTSDEPDAGARQCQARPAPPPRR